MIPDYECPVCGVRWRRDEGGPRCADPDLCTAQVEQRYEQEVGTWREYEAEQRQAQRMEGPGLDPEPEEET